MGHYTCYLNTLNFLLRLRTECNRISKHPSSRWCTYRELHIRTLVSEPNFGIQRDVVGLNTMASHMVISESRVSRVMVMGVIESVLMQRGCQAVTARLA